MKPNLKFTASKIAKAEKNNNANFFDVLGGLASRPSMTALLFLFNAGGGTDEQFDKVFENDGLEGVMGAILEGLGDGGFLPKDAVKEAKEALVKASETTEASENTGETTKS